MDRPGGLCILLGLILSLSLVQQAFASKTKGTLFIKFLNYTNPRGKLANGHCCDGKWMFCQPHGCDYKFKICADIPPLDSNMNNCGIGLTVSTQEIENQDNVLFTSRIGELKNPLKFDLKSEHLTEGSAALKVQVWDDDPGINKNDYVDLVSATLNLHQHLPKIYILKSRTRLAILTTIKCAEFRYGIACDVYCKPRDDAGGHYTCMPATGKKICKKDWKGTDCENRTTPIGPDYCKAKPCRNGGRCYSGKSGPQCDCTYRFSGRFCERHKCELTCLPGRCSASGPQLPTCVCPSGYTSYRGLWPKCLKIVIQSTAPVPETTTAATHPPFTTALSGPQDCDQFAQGGDAKSDKFIIRVKGLPSFRVWCDIERNTGWTLIQRRVDASVNFNRNWAEYKKGFGILGENTNYWMGLEKIHHLTTQKYYKLRVVIWETRSDKKSYKLEANYKRFWVSTEGNKYRLHVDGYSGNAGNALEYHNGEAFSTPERDNDKLKWGGNCAKLYGSGWWFKRCYRANLNGPYPSPKSSALLPGSTHKITWLSKHGSVITRVVMKVAPSVGSLQKRDESRQKSDAELARLAQLAQLPQMMLMRELLRVG